MIVSHEHRYVFIKTRKTAGTSVELALAKHCGPADIITRQDDEGELLRRRMGARGPQHDGVPVRAMTLGRLKEGLYQRRWPKLYDHFPVKPTRRLVGRSRWDDYLTFTIERNPWDRAVSFYYFALHKGRQLPFSEFVATEPYLSNFWMYSIDGKVCVDRVLRYEALNDELAEVWRSLSLPGEPEMPNAKGTIRPKSTHDYREMYTQREVDLVAAACRSEIDAFGYTFD